MQWKRLLKFTTAICGFLSAILIFYSVGVTSSSFKPLMSNDGVSLCYDGKQIAAGWGGSLVSAGACPGWDQGKAAAVVTYEHASLLKPAIFLLIVSFVLQFVDIGTDKPGTDQPKTERKDKSVSESLIPAGYEFQLKESSELRAFAYSLVTGKHYSKHGNFERKDYIGMAMFSRCLQTHEAVELLVKQSLVDDGLVLVRSLVEHAVNAVYMIMIADAATADAFADYGDYLVYQQFADLKATEPTLMATKVNVEEEKKMRDRYDAVRVKFDGKRGDKWCVHDALYKRAGHLDRTLRQPEEGTEWRLLVNAVWRHASTYTHGTARALAGQITEEGEIITIHRKPTYEEAEEVLTAANNALYFALLPVAGRLGLNLAPIHERFGKWTTTMSAIARSS